MSSEPNIKAWNRMWAVSFTIWCIALYAAFQAGDDGVLSKFIQKYDQLRTKDGVVCALAPLIAIVLTGLLSSENKARLIFLRFKNALPGHRAFSELIERDSRIDVAKLRALVCPWPTTPRDENTTWYKIYKQHANLPSVIDAHRAFLRTRDLATIAFMFTVLAPWGIVCSQEGFSLAMMYSAVMFAHYVVLAIVSRNHAERFVCTVLAEHTVPVTE